MQLVTIDKATELSWQFFFMFELNFKLIQCHKDRNKKKGVLRRKENLNITKYNLSFSS